MIERGEVWWADLPAPSGSGPGRRRPVVVISSDRFNRSRIGTVTVALITSNTSRSESPGNVFLTGDVSGLPTDSVVNVSQLTTVDRRTLTSRVGVLPFELQDAVDNGLRLALGLSA